MVNTKMETVIIALVVILVVGVTIAIALLPESSDKQVLKPPVDSLPQRAAPVQNERTDVTFINPEGPFAQDDPTNPAAKPVNEKLFDENKAGFASLSYKIQQTRFVGKILTIDRSNGLTMNMSSLLPNSLGAQVTYHFEPQVLNKIKVVDGTLESLAVDQEINIDETNDYTKDYQESIQAVEISTVSSKGSK